MNQERVKVAKEFGPFLVGRGIGATIREKRFEGTPDTWPETLDFADVEQATESCIDELLGALARKWGKEQLSRIRIENCSRPVRETINYVVGLIERPPPPPTPESVSVFLRKKRPRVNSTRRSRKPQRRKLAHKVR